jgi:toxin ParE1/3/4
MTREIRLTLSARRDIARVLQQSAEAWGPAAEMRYASLVAAALDRVRTDAEAVPPLDLPGRGGVRAFHLRRVRDAVRPPVGNPSHMVLYRILDVRTVVVLRLLHERMDPARHIGDAS